MSRGAGRPSASASAASAARAPASGRTHLWQPLGPATVVDGEVIGATRVSGRVTMLAVEEGGDRVYAASANGGVWYSGDGGVHWRSLEGLAATPAPGTVARPAHRNACGAIAVRFGVGGAADTVYVGTGEPWHAYGNAGERRAVAQPGQPSGGVGILVGTYDPASGVANWVREAANLLGAGVYRIALEPGGNRIVAATSTGLYERPANDAEAAWTRAAGDPLRTVEVDCTDVLWTAGAGATPPRLWVWIERGSHAGLWMMPTHAAGASWQQVGTPGARGRRAVLAAATAQEVWLFCDHPGTTTRSSADPGHSGTPRAASAGPPAADPASHCDCWFRSSGDVRQGFVQLIERAEPQPVTYSVIKGRAIFEGDIDLGSEAEMEQRRTALGSKAPAGALRGIVVTGQALRWPGAVVPFETTGDLRSRVERAMAHWESRTRVRFVERVAANSALYPNWVSFEAIDGCYSQVGMRGGKQVISLTDGCDFGAAVHEIGHALGLWHEQSREDRDANVTVHLENVKAGEAHNFAQHIVDGDDIGVYDYASIMHYTRTAFSKNGNDTIVPNNGRSIGQHDGLSTGDVSAINSIYPDLVRPLLFRIAAGADPLARPVLDIPDVLGNDGHYSIALAVHPSRPKRVVLGGARHAVNAPGLGRLRNDGRLDDAAVLAADVDVDGRGVLVFALPPLTPSRLGVGVHAHVHHVVYSNGGDRLWVACDGGVYRSDHPDSPVGFAAVNDGLSVVEAHYVACHPVNEGAVIAGARSLGVVERRSGAVWARRGSGDAGGVVFDPTQLPRYVAQSHFGDWQSSDGTFSVTASALEKGPEHSARYSTPAMVIKQRPGAPAGAQTITQVIVGTSRLWYSEDSGTSWVTLRSGVAPPPGDLAQDRFGDRITVCRWQGSEVAWVLGEGRLRRYARTAGTDVAAGPGTWTDETVVAKGVKASKDTTDSNGPFRDAAVWTDVAVNLEAGAVMRGSRGAVYLGTSGKADDDEVDTLWWFDGSNDWHPTRLRRDGVPAPVTAIVCDAAFPDEVYVGTTIGVWKGIRNLADPAAPTWAWSSRLNGLPEATIQDLAIFSRDGLRLLRAGIASRGVWELRLDAADVADLAYLRAHADDLRHRLPSSPIADNGVLARSWHASPDVHVRRAPLAPARPATLPWTRGAPGIEPEALRRFQSALRARLGDQRIRPTGRWDVAFNELLRSLGAPTVGNTVRLDAAFWDQSLQMPWAVAEPWGGAQPSVADLMEFSAELPPQPARTAAACELPRDASKVDVLVHFRGLAPLDGAAVRVTLLKWIDPQARPTSRSDDVTTWPGGNAPWTTAANEVLNSASGATGQALGSGWSFVGATNATRRRTLAGQTLDPLQPGIATFDLDLSLVPDDRLVLLVAVIRAGADVALPADTLENLALGQPHVAVRSLRVHGASVAAPAARSPFATVPYANEMVPSVAQNARLAAALASVRGTLDAANADRLDKAALIVAKLTPGGPMDYAGVRETEMYFSASLLKAVLLYASFELVAQVNALAPTLTATTAKRFFDAVEREFAATIAHSVRRIKPGPWRTTSFRQALTATAAGAGQWRVRLSDMHDAELRQILANPGQNITPRNTMHRLGYSFVNRALETAGFLDTDTDTGLWMATDYGDWSDFNVPVATRSSGRNPKAGNSSAAMTALSMASLWALIQRRQLIDATASQTMWQIIERGGAWLRSLPAATQATFSFTDTGAKVGHSGSGSAFVGSVQSEAAFLDRTSDHAPFLAVWQNVPDELGAEPIYRVLDQMIRTWP